MDNSGTLYTAGTNATVNQTGAPYLAMYSNNTWQQLSCTKGGHIVATSVIFIINQVNNVKLKS